MLLPPASHGFARWRMLAGIHSSRSRRRKMSFARNSRRSTRTNARIMAALCGALLLAACAAPESTRDARGNPRIDRLSDEQVARLAGPAQKLTADDLLRMTRDGQTPEQIIERLRSTATRLRLSTAQSGELASQGVSRQVLDWISAAEERARQTDSIDAQVRRETAEAQQRKDKEAREALARQRALQNRRYDPYYGDPYSPWVGVPWPGYWGWRWNYPPRNGIGMFWRGR
jgi:hypothetical protein